MKKRWLVRLVSLIIIVVLFFVTLPGSLQAARQGQRVPPPPSGEISEEKRPWPGTPWLICIALSAGAVAVGLKNARRTHLD
ncbi:MAG: hypothetical protein KAJ46_03240 [Sedimentisphaerales bacterium]|nr:hypothetical protein [Sedimentisphaerales bacterium]